MSKIITKWIADDAVDKTKLNADVAGDGLEQAAGGELDIKADAVGGANLAIAINVDPTNGLAVKVDDVAIEENGSGQLALKAGGVDETALATSVAGDGISGGGGTALALDIPGLTDEATADNADTIAVYDASAGAHREMTRANFLGGLSSETVVHAMHLITAGEDTAGFFTLPSTPVSAGIVRGTPVGGNLQNNKANVGATGATPDFDILNGDEFHFNNNGAATGLSEDLATGDVVLLTYQI